MRKHLSWLSWGAVATALLLVSGCIRFDLTALLDGIDNIDTDAEFVFVDVVNETAFDVDPFIAIADDPDDDEADVIEPAVVLPGEVVELDFECDDLGLIFSDRPQQFVDGDVFEALPSVVLERGRDYFCGDLIEIVFMGNEFDFDVFTFVNGVPIR